MPGMQSIKNILSWEIPHISRCAQEINNLNNPPNFVALSGYDTDLSIYHLWLLWVWLEDKVAYLQQMLFPQSLKEFLSHFLLDDQRLLAPLPGYFVTAL